MSEIERLVWAVRESAQKQAALSLHDTPEMDVREFVRAILTALREPSEGMIAAGIKQAAECTDDWSASAPCIAEHVFPAMIDHILNEEADG